jgi:iron uptake system component EfeO
VKFHTTLAALAAVLAGVSLTSCQAKETTSTDEGKGGASEITVNASDSACELSGTETSAGPSTFVVTNNGTKVTEFYVYGEGERVMGEVENISPGLQRKLIVQLAEPGTYQTACKPGMVGDGIRSDFKVTGEAVKVDTEGKFKEASESYKRSVNSQTDALVAATEVRRGGQEGRHQLGQGAIPHHAYLLRAHRAGRRVLPQRPRPTHRPA